MSGYKQFGLFLTKQTLEDFQKLCDDAGISQEFYLEMVVDCLVRSFQKDSKFWWKTEFASRAYYEALKEELQK